MRRFSMLLVVFLCAETAAAAPQAPRRPFDKHAFAALPPETPVQRVVVKFQEGSHVRLRDGRLVALAVEPDKEISSSGIARDLAAVEEILAPRKAAGSGLGRLFTATEEALASHKAEGEAKSGRVLADLDLYYGLSLPAGTTQAGVAGILERLNALASVEIAYAQPYPQEAAADIPPETPDFQPMQSYMRPAPIGIDAFSAWTWPGGRGEGVRIVDVENNWNVRHEDLPHFFHRGGTLPDGPNHHGTAVAGMLVGVDNGFGVTGIANKAKFGYEGVAFQSTASATVNASIAGDVVLVNVQFAGPRNQSPCDCSPEQCDVVPAEYLPDVFDAISLATALGDVVVEAAGNGSSDLDDRVYEGLFDRTERDSGALLVGAIAPIPGAPPSCFTNYGSRVDLHGWGNFVTTAGYGDLFTGRDDLNQFYTRIFNGTSSAAPMVAGAAAIVLGVARAAGGDLTPAEVRSLLVSTGTPQTPSDQHLGAFPNLQAAVPMAALAVPNADWLQWGRDAQHTSSNRLNAQPAERVLADIVYDPFADAEIADTGGGLLVHYQVPLVEGDSVYMMFKTGEFTGMDTWHTQVWNERRLRWDGDDLVTVWNFASDWKPVPRGFGGLGPSWEPVFHPALSGPYIYIPGAGGSVFKVNKADGTVVQRIKPFGARLNRNIFVAGPITADAAGNIYYNAIHLSDRQPWLSDPVNSWLVKVSPNGTALKATYASLTPGAPAGNARCLGFFGPPDLPWPPSPNAVPPMIPCGAQRTGLNIAPAIAPDGTIYTASVAHTNNYYAYLIAVRPNLKLKWAASLRKRFNDGCNVLLPPNGTPGGCRAGAKTGVDPAQNRPGSGRVQDNLTSSPIVAPDGSVFFGTHARYIYGQGHLMKFSPDGEYLGAYPYGRDITPGIFQHDGTYSLFLKDNRYGFGSYCDHPEFCPSDRTQVHPDSPEAYYVTRLSKDLLPEWTFRNTSTEACTREPSGEIVCAPDENHQHGFEWCINALAIDRNGDVHGNSEDGYLYVIDRNGNMKQRIFLQAAQGAAYTPLSIGPDGRIYTQNKGHLIVVGR